MREWLDNLAGPQYASAVMWTVGALILLVIVLFVIRILRRVSSGTFVAGGRNRRTRLAVMDAAAIDNQRRLVLVRRDEVEHLILIGGPTDVVVEQNIVPTTALHTPAAPAGSELSNGRNARPTPQPAHPAPERPRATVQERRDPPVAIETPAPRAPESTVANAPRTEPVLSAEPEVSIAAPVLEARNTGTPASASGSVHFLDNARIAPAPQAANMAPLTAEREAAAPEVRPSETDRRTEPLRREARPADLDAALQEELKAPLVGAAESRQAAEPSLEEEMKRLLGELSAPARG